MSDNSDRAIIETIRRLSGTYGYDFVHYANAEVNSIDEKKRSVECTLLDGKVQHKLTAKLMPSVDDGLLIIPKVGSVVKVIYSDLVEAFVCQYSAIESIVIDAEKIQFNDGKFGGLVNAQALILKLNALETALGQPLTQLAQIVNKNITHG